MFILWLIYLKDKECRQKLFREVFQIKNQTVSVYDSNPFSFDDTNQRDSGEVLKVKVSGVPLSVQDTKIHVVSMLLNLNAELKS